MDCYAADLDVLFKDRLADRQGKRERGMLTAWVTVETAPPPEIISAAVPLRSNSTFCPSVTFVTASPPIVSAGVRREFTNVGVSLKSVDL